MFRKLYKSFKLFTYNNLVILKSDAEYSAQTFAYLQCSKWLTAMSQTVENEIIHKFRKFKKQKSREFASRLFCFNF
jgi:hypothetical protein